MRREEVRRHIGHAWGFAGSACHALGRVPLALSVLLLAACGQTDRRTASASPLPSESPTQPSQPSQPSQPAQPSQSPGGATTTERRLRAVFVGSSEGVEVFRDFRDTQLQTDCRFVEADVGEWRCLPFGTDVANITGIVYADADCTRLAAAVLPPLDANASCSQARYASVLPGCGQPGQVFELGDELATDTRYAIVDGVCLPHREGTDYLTTLFEATALPLEQFQPARLSVGEPTGGVVPLQLETDDGTTTLVGFRDARENFDCQLVGPDADGRCVPTDLGVISGTFADPACSEPAAIAMSCAETRAALRFAAELGEHPIYHRAGARLTAAYTGGPASCMAWTTGIGFEIGQEVPLEAFAAGHRTVRAAAQLTSTADTIGRVSLPPGRLRSMAYGGYDCYVARGSDGQLRCLPEPETLTSGYFADDGCSQPVDSTSSDFLALRVPDVCPAQVRVYARGERHTGSVYTLRDGTCAFFSEHPAGDSARSPFYAFPTELPPDEFAALSVALR